LRCRGTQFHPAVVDAFLRLIERDRAQGAAQLRRIAGILHEDIEDVPGPGVLLEQFAASAQTHGRQLAILQRLASEISAVLDIDALAERLLRIICDAMGYENGFLLTLDAAGEHLVIRAAFSREDEDLLTAVSHQVAAAVRVAKLHQAAKTAAATDPLTGLPNRRSFFLRLECELAARDGASLSVAIVDANGLKALNDGFGHAAGDEALVRVGAILQAGVREGDLVARIGGDEFAGPFAGSRT